MGKTLIKNAEICSTHISSFSSSLCPFFLCFHYPSSCKILDFCCGEVPFDCRSSSEHPDGIFEYITCGIWSFPLSHSCKFVQLTAVNICSYHCHFVWLPRKQLQWRIIAVMVLKEHFKYAPVPGPCCTTSVVKTAINNK